MKVSNEQLVQMKVLAESNKQDINNQNFNAYAILIMVDEIMSVISKYECEVKLTPQILEGIKYELDNSKIKKG